MDGKPVTQEVRGFSLGRFKISYCESTLPLKILQKSEMLGLLWHFYESDEEKFTQIWDTFLKEAG